MPGVESSLVEVVLADKGEDAIVEIQALVGKDRNVFGELGGIGILGFRGLRLRLLLLLGAVKGGKRGFDAEAAFPATTLGGGFLRSGVGEEAEGDEGWRRREAVARCVEGLDVG